MWNEFPIIQGFYLLIVMSISLTLGVMENMRSDETYEKKYLLDISVG